MKLPVWMFLTKEWLKKNWKWLLFPIGMLLVVLGYGLASRKKVIVTSTALAGADEAKVRINEEAADKVRAADAQEAGQLAGIDAQHSAAVASTTQEQLNAVKDAEGDPEKVNALLADVGKQMRN